MFDDSDKEEVFTSKPVELQNSNRPLLLHEKFKLAGIKSEIRKAKTEAKRNNGPRAIQVPKLSKALINNLIKSGYQIFLVSPDSTPTLKWYVVSW